MKTAILFILLATLSIKGYSQNIVFDNTFANTGTLIIPSAATSTISVFDIDQSGNIISAGYTSQGIGTGIYKLTVSKTNQNGVLDIKFGTNGVSIISLGVTEYPYAIKVLNNSKILVGGKTSFPDTIPSGSFLVRLNTNGSIDSSFADKGVYKLTGADSHINSINILSDNSIILGGDRYRESGVFYEKGLLVKLNENGVPDPQFGLNGVLNLTSTNFNFHLRKSIKTENDEIIAVGFEYTDPTNLKIAYCKTDSHGNFVSTFGTDGKVIKD